MQAKIISLHPCDDTAQVVTAVGGGGTFRREVCAECPWRLDAAPGAFPAEAYRHSARTCADMAGSTFACHMSGSAKPATCAGFLLSKHARHSMAIRLQLIRGDIDLDAVRATAPTYDDYREMAEANGVEWDDPALSCVGSD